MSKAYNNSLPNVVILGAGGAGAKIAHELSEKLNASAYNLVLINDRPYYTHFPAMIRMVVTSAQNLEETALVPLDKNFVNGNGTLIVGTVTALEPAKDGSSGGEVILASGEKVPYAILVLATGSIWEGPLALPIGKPEAAKWAGEWRRQFERAQSVVLVGGGAVGIEFAGEIKDYWPNKKVTIVQGDHLLLNSSYPDKFRKFNEQQLRTRGVDIIFDDFVDSIPEAGSGTVTTRKGQVLRADLVVPTRGGRPNTGFIKTSLPDVVDSSNRVKVTPTFQLPGHPTIFAAGDITDIQEQKQVGKYPGHAAIITANILSLTQGQQPAKEYKKGAEMILITNGKNGGAAYIGIWWGIVLGNWFARTMKSKELFVKMTRTSLGYKE